MLSVSAARRLGVALLAAAAIVAGSPASAQQGEWKYDKLNDMLQRKFSEPQSENAQPQPGVGNPLPQPVETAPRTRGIQPIEPDERALKYHQLQKESNASRASRASLPGAAVAGAAGARDPRARTRSIVPPP